MTLGEDEDLRSEVLMENNKTDKDKYEDRASIFGRRRKRFK